MKKILLVHLGANGDCLMATTIARQIKHDYPDSHLTWAISYKYKHIIDNNPDIDSIWEVNHTPTESPFANVWYEIKKSAEKKKAREEYDLVFYTQIYPENIHYYDGTTRSSTFNGYPGKITVPVVPIVNLATEEVSNVKDFVKEKNLGAFKKVILFECTPGSNQSLLNPEIALDVSKSLVESSADTLVVISSHIKIKNVHERIIDGSVLTFRENAELANYCTHFIGCSSGITWLITSNQVKQLPMLQILKRNALGFGFASVKYDFKHWKLSTDHILETTENNKEKLKKIVFDFTTDFSKARMLYDEDLKPLVYSFKKIITLKELGGNVFKFIQSVRHFSNRNKLNSSDLMRIIGWIIVQIFFYYSITFFSLFTKLFRNILLNLPYGSKILVGIKWRLKHFKVLWFKSLTQLQDSVDSTKKDTVNSVSVIVVGRNDNYGGDFSKRLQTTLDWNLSHLPNPELIYIEWNPILSNPSDCKWVSERYSNCKCYIVPNEIHNIIATYPEKMKVMEYFGKNLGIRRASSDWIILTNADVLLGPDILKNTQTLDKDALYGGHYVNIYWDGNPIDENTFSNKKNIKNSFSAYEAFESSVGNFILTNKKNWMMATGYDETLKGSRAGVDRNGYIQLKHFGLKTKVIGHHFHLDHPESIINTPNQDSHGDKDPTINNKNIPYKNDSSWGLINYPLKQISDKIWELQPI